MLQGLNTICKCSTLLIACSWTLDMVRGWHGGIMVRLQCAVSRKPISFEWHAREGSFEGAKTPKWAKVQRIILRSMVERVRNGGRTQSPSPGCRGT